MNKHLVVFNEQEFPQLYEMSFEERVQLYSEVEAKSFYLRGKILESIKQDKSYKEAGYKTFEKAVKDILDISRGFAYKILDATNVYENLSTNCGQNLPLVESQIRPLTNLNPEQQIEVWKELAKDRIPTAKEVNNFVKAKFKSAEKINKKTKKEPEPIITIDNTRIEELELEVKTLQDKIKELQQICISAAAIEVELNSYKKKYGPLEDSTIRLRHGCVKDGMCLIPREEAFEYVRRAGNDIQSMAVKSETLPNDRLFGLLVAVRNEQLKTVPPSGIPNEILNATGIE